MGLLDSILGGVMGGGAQTSPVARILMSLLGGGGQQSGMGGGAMGALSGLMGGNQQQQPTQDGAGGLSGLLGRFQQAGLGGVAQSWVGHGANQPVSPDQLQQVLGQDQVQNMAQQTGMQPNDLLSQLSQYLPGVVDKMTPNGQLPEGGDPFAGGQASAFDGPGIPAGKTFRT